MIAANTRLTADQISQIRAEQGIIDVLRRAGIDCPDTAGRDAMISCPTPGHEDFTPSCIVHPACGTFYCFGCGAHGDVFTLVHEITGISNLAQVAGLLEGGGPISWRSGAQARGTAIPAGRPTDGPDPDRTPRERVVEVNNAAWRYLTGDRLADQARVYLARRGIDVWNVEARAGGPVAGYTAASRSGLTDHLRRLGFTVEEVLDAGWTLRRPGALFDRFHRRVLFPIRDANGDVAGVIGRDITDRARCKYVNMPRTAAYCKGELLYRPAVTGGSISTVVVCEGPLDALAIMAAAASTRREIGIHAVAPCGTALTGDQARLIASIEARAVIVCTDADSGGIAAAAKWQAKLRAHQLTPRVITLPDGHDPASWLAQRGPSGIDALLADAVNRHVASSAQHPSFDPDGGLTA